MDTNRPTTNSEPLNGRHSVNSRKRAVSLDIIIPFYNEEDMVEVLFDTLGTVFSRAACKGHGIRRVRYVIVDDGSTDKTALMVKDHIEKGVPATLLRLSRNFGHQNALTAGLARADADLVAVIDGDRVSAANLHQRDRP